MPNLTKQDILALNAVWYGANTNNKLYGGAKYYNGVLKETISFYDALIHVQKLIELAETELEVQT